MGRPGKGITTSMDLSTRRSNKKKGKVSISDITNQYLRKFLKKFQNSSYLGYKSKQIHNYPTEDYCFLIKQINNLIKRDSRVQLHTKGIK